MKSEMAQYGNMTLRERENKLRKKNEEKSHDSSDTSVRETKKSKKLNPLPKHCVPHSRSKYDEKGLEKDTKLDLCDCLDDTCPGCWFECPNCGSRKCGHECRCYRRFKYEYIAIEGSEVVIKNKH